MFDIIPDEHDSHRIDSGIGYPYGGILATCKKFDYIGRDLAP